MTNIRYQKRKANVLVITTVNSNRFSNLVKKVVILGNFRCILKFKPFIYGNYSWYF